MFPDISSKIVCYKCKQPGHISRNCDQPSEPKHCYVCGDINHMANTCEKRAQKSKN